jgi:hypothetical protein
MVTISSVGNISRGLHQSVIAASQHIDRRSGGHTSSMCRVHLTSRFYCVCVIIECEGAFFEPPASAKTSAESMPP